MSSPDWRELMKKYARFVVQQEGVYFLEEYSWTPEEWVEISKLKKELFRGSK